MERNHNLHGSLWVNQKDFAERLSRRFKGVWNEKFHGWNVECPYCPKHENKRKDKQRKRGARIIEGSNGGWMLQCAICSSDGRDTAGVSLSKLLKENHPRLHKEWEESWDAVMNQRATKERLIEKPLPIMNRRTDERTEYKKRSFKEKQAVKSMALEFMQKRSGQ